MRGVGVKRGRHRAGVPHVDIVVGMVAVVVVTMLLALACAS